MEVMENRIIIDSDVLVNFLRNKEDDVNLIAGLRKEAILGTTDINVFELYYGAYKSGRQAESLATVKGLLNTLFLVSTREDVMEIAAKIQAEMDKRGSPIGFRDTLIASICLTQSTPLLTRNKKHFESIEGLKLVDTGI